MAWIDYQGLTNMYTYMGWSTITDPTSLQYQLREDAGENYDSEGFGIIDGRYVIACTERYGGVGDAIDWTLANGNILHTIIGDIKSSSDPNNNGWGHVSGSSISIIEFVVNTATWYNPPHVNPGNPGCHPEWAGQLQGYVNCGNYWGSITPSGSVGTMPDLMFISGMRYSNGAIRKVSYLATLQEDGYMYFNDDMFWRCSRNGANVQVFYPSKNIWIRTNSLWDIQIGSFIQGSSSGNAGSGAGVSPNANVETAVKWMISKASNEYVTYSQSVRNLKNPDGDSYDCSSFVITGFYVGGFDVAAIYTGDMKSGFMALGFEWIPGWSFPADELVRGDILLNEVNHTQVYIGNNQDVNCGSTPARVIAHANDRWGEGWDGVLRYAG